MSCPTCGAANPAGARFCNNCGARLPEGCPDCGHVNPADARFCNNCGRRLQDAPSAAPAAAPANPLDRYLPPEMRAKLEAARRTRAGAGERRIVTILFCDVKGSTAAAGQLDPEEWADIINGAFEHMIEPVYRYEGTVARLMGDGILAFFGAPIAHEDDPQRAVLAGLEIVDRIAAYRDLVARRWKLPIEVRVGVNTGLVLVGEVGSDMRMEYTALGDAINLAARMEQTAAPGTVQAAHDTHRLAAPLFDWEDLGLSTVAGKSQPVHTWRPLRARTEPGRLRGLESHGISSPLVGRQRELAAVRRALADLHEGRGGIVSLVGEAGLGKSRLVAELRQEALQTDQAGGPTDGSPGLRWVEARCLSYSAGAPHALSAALLRALLGVADEAAPQATSQALHGVLDSLPALRAEDVYPFLGHLLNLPLDEAAAARVQFLAGPALMARYGEALRALLGSLARQQPLVVAADDLHWADPSSVDLLLHLLPAAAQSPLLFLFLARAERETPGWRLIGQAREVVGIGALELHLAPLSEVDSQQLVNNLLTIDALPEAVRARILAKAEGNPFFVEEVIRMLIDRNLVVRADGQWTTAGKVEALDIPDNLNGVLAARIDRLSEEARYVLQVASVVGRQFYTRVLVDVLAQEGAR